VAGAEVTGLGQAVLVVQAAVETAVAMHLLVEQLVRLIWAVVAAVVVQIAPAVVKLWRVVQAVQAWRSCKFKHRCTRALRLDHLLLRLQVDLQL
jgi:hypothetical protein